MSIGKLLDIARTGLLTYQSALTVSSNNITNASNEDYSRQVVYLGAKSTEYVNGLSIGAGVEITDVVRMRDELLDTQISSYKSKYSASEQSVTTLSNLESLLSEPSSLGLSSLLDDFFNSWDGLSEDASSTSLRNEVINSAQNLASKLQNVYEGYADVKKDTQTETSSMADSLNSYISQIYDLNKEISAVASTGGSANDLMDERTALINEMSELANITVNYNDDQTVSISIGGIFAVDGTTSVEFALQEENGEIALVTAEGGTKANVTSGKIAANIELYNDTIPDYLSQLDTIGTAIYDAVNSVHSTGYTNTSTPQTGVNFFSSYADGVLVINEDIVDDPNMIAASSVSGQEGNNDIALQIAELADTAYIDGNTISEAYSNFVNDIATNIEQQTQNVDSYELVLEELDAQVSEVSGVSVDEELVNVIKYQSAYQASARLITVANELFDTLLSSF